MHSGDYDVPLDSPEAEPMVRRPEPSALANASGIQALPTSLLLDQIFSWIAPPARILDDLIIQGHEDPTEYNSRLFTVQQVCRAWHWHAKALAANYRALTWRLHEVDMVYQLTRSIAPRAPSSNVTQLRIELCRPYLPTMGIGRRAFFNSERLCLDVEKFIPSTYWTDVFSGCPALVRLDLSRVPYTDDLLAAILDAASACCPKIQSLVLPIHNGGDSNWMEGTNVLALLARVLPMWNETIRGLVHLALPWYRFGAATLRQLLEIVVKSCPKIRFLRDWTNHPEFDTDDARDYGGGYLLPVDLPGWCFACATILTSLQEMHWRIPSNCTPFVRAFAETIKPQLKNMYLDYTWCPGEPFNFPALDATTVGSFFKATPNLERFSLVTDRYELQLDLGTPHDLIVTKLREHCPKLKALRIDVGVRRDDRHMVPMVTDVGVEEILRMAATLRQLTLRPVRISSKQIVAVLDACMKRELVDIEITLFPRDHELELAETVLQRLVAMNISFCASRPRFVLRIPQTSSNDFPEKTRTQLESLSGRLNAKWGVCGHAIQAMIGTKSRFELLLRWNFPARHPAAYQYPLPIRRWRELKPHFEQFKEQHREPNTVPTVSGGWLASLFQVHSHGHAELGL